MFTQVTGTTKPARLPDAVSCQMTLQCGCRVEHSSTYYHPTAVIGGKRFTAGESLIRGKRCGSVATLVMGGCSTRYGLVKQFVRVLCRCVRVMVRVHDFAIVTWFPRPVYPDRDPLTVRIDLRGLDVNDIRLDRS